MLCIKFLWLTYLLVLSCVPLNNISPLTPFPVPGYHHFTVFFFFLSLTLDSTCKWYHMVFFFLSLIYLSIMSLKTIHVIITSGRIFFFLVVEQYSVVCVWHGPHHLYPFTFSRVLKVVSISWLMWIVLQ